MLTTKEIFNEANRWADLEKANGELEKGARIRMLGICLFGTRYPQYKDILLDCLAEAQELIEGKNENNYH